jgi:hypothetical protein
MHNLPAQPTPFVGRETELADLDRMLSDPEVRLVTVLGAEGMGGPAICGLRRRSCWPSWRSSRWWQRSLVCFGGRVSCPRACCANP